MKKIMFSLLFWVVLISACSSPDQPQSTPSVQVSPSQSITITFIPKPTTTATVSRPDNTAAPPSPTPSDTVTPSPTHPPTGIFAIKFYPPLVLDYLPDQWIDQSEYGNTEMMVNYLQSKELKTCTIGPRGPSGWYPDNMKEITLGDIRYQALLNQKITTGEIMSVYFALNASKGSIENEIGVPIFDVKSNPAEERKCRLAVEELLGTLRRAD